MSYNGTTFNIKVLKSSAALSKTIKEKDLTMANVKHTVKTKVGDLKYVFIKGEGRNQAMKGEPDHFMYVASIVTQKDSPLHKDMKSQVQECWKEYSAANGVKGAPKSTGIKPIMVETDEVDEYGAKIRVESDDVIITFKTNTTWPDGNQNKVKVLDGKGKDLTEAFLAAPWSIGEGSRGIIHGIAMGNDAGGSHKVTLYLSAIQLAKLVKYEGTSIDAEEIEEAEDLDIGIEAISESDTEKPEI